MKWNPYKSKFAHNSRQEEINAMWNDSERDGYVSRFVTNETRNKNTLAVFSNKDTYLDPILEGFLSVHKEMMPPEYTSFKIKAMFVTDDFSEDDRAPAEHLVYRITHLNGAVRGLTAQFAGGSSFIATNYAKIGKEIIAKRVSEENKVKELEVKLEAAKRFATNQRVMAVDADTRVRDFENALIAAKKQATGATTNKWRK